MTFQESVKTVLSKKYATFEGRATRSEYWWYTLFCIIVAMVCLFFGLVLGTLFGGAAVLQDADRALDMGVAGLGIGFLIGYVILLIFGLATLIPSIAVSVRRLHDSGHSGWWYLICFVPYVGSLVLLIFMLLEGQPGDNKYGPAPDSPAPAAE